MKSAAVTPYHQCHSCVRFCSEIESLVEIAREFIAVGDTSRALADFAKLETAVCEYKTHLASHSAASETTRAATGRSGRRNAA